MLEIFKLGAILTQKGVIEDVKQAAIFALDAELNIGRDRAEIVVINVVDRVSKYLKERGIL